MSFSDRNVILTGPPRSGTTLTCSLLNKVPNVVALHEPMSVGELAGLSEVEVLEYVARFFDDSRRSLHESGEAPSNVREGRVPDNPYAESRDENNRRSRVATPGVLRVEKRLERNFVLAVKHPAAFTALLPLLVRHWPCFAVIRNPLGTVMSWASLGQLHVGRGRLPMGEMHDPDLGDMLNSLPDVRDRQLHILDWCFSRYTNFLPSEQLIRYERLIESSGAALAVIDPAAASLTEPLSSKNANSLYDRTIVANLADRMIERGGAWEAFYPATSIRQLAEQILATGR